MGKELIMYSESVFNASKSDLALLNELFTFAAPNLADDTAGKNLMHYDFLKNLLKLKDYRNCCYLAQLDPLLSV